RDHQAGVRRRVRTLSLPNRTASSAPGKWHRRVALPVASPTRCRTFQNVERPPGSFRVCTRALRSWRDWWDRQAAGAECAAKSGPRPCCLRRIQAEPVALKPEDSPERSLGLCETNLALPPCGPPLHTPHLVASTGGSC